MEWPEGFHTPFHAQCLLLNKEPSLPKVPDHECEAETDSGHRLGAANRLAVYRSAHKNVQRQGGNRCTEAGMGMGFYSLCPAGWACWSLRLFDAIDRLSVPVVMADDIIQPFEDFLPYASFTEHVNVSRLLSTNDRAVLEALHRNADAARNDCSGCIECDVCQQSKLAVQVKNLEMVRPWLSYSPKAQYGVVSLFLIELMCRLDRAGRRKDRFHGIPSCPSNLHRHNLQHHMPL